MKKMLFISLLSVLFASCSNKLSESKVDKLVKECMKKNPVNESTSITTGKVSFLSEDDINKYKALEKRGFLKIEKKEEKNVWFTHNYYLVSLTDKSKPYILETKENYEDNTINIVKLCTFKLDKVGAIQEIPSMNTAEVSIIMKKEEKTPFYDVLEADKTEFKTKKILLRKTENQGWIYCD